MKDRVIICLSFYGLDKPSMLPPNIHLTGPCLKPADELQALEPDL
jgi:hypothetical protein